MEYKNDFPIFENDKDLVYLDSAATSQRPKVVIQAITKFYEEENANINRGLYKLSENATNRYDSSRKKFTEFINAEENEIVFTKNCTEAINLIASSIASIIPEGKDNIVITEMEHHSNIVPWQELAKRTGLKLRFVKITDNYELDYADAENKIDSGTAIVSVTHVSNVLGTINDIKKITSLAKENNSFVIVDAAQSISHMKIDVKEIGCDFLAFSSHKMLGPGSIGILYGRYSLLEKMAPYQFGGGMIEKVTKEKTTYALPPMKFEAGTQNVAEAIGLSSAIDYLNKVGMSNIHKNEEDLKEYTLNKLSKIEDIEIYHPKNAQTLGIISFNLKGIHAHDVAQILSDNNICVRAGHHCAMPLMQALNIAGAVRVSLSLYNTKEDIDKLIISLNKCKEVFLK